MPKIVRTVGGDVRPADLGPADSHEHLFLTTPLQPGDGFSDVDRAVEEARSLVASGGKALVDWTPIGVGRNPQGLLRVSEATGLHIVAATGAHGDAHYGQDHRGNGRLATARRRAAPSTGPIRRS